MTLPLAHLGHWLWVFYLLPVLIVVAGVIRSSWAERRKGRLDESEPAVAKSRKARTRLGRGAKKAS